MALHVKTALFRCLRTEVNGVQLLWLRNKSKKPEKEEVLPESIDAPLYTSEIPEAVLERREKHLPDPKLESPFQDHKRECVLCRLKITPDYKNVRLLSQFVSGFSGIVYDRHITGLCTKRQKQIEAEILKARWAGLMPWTYKFPHYQNDPQLFNPTKPVRPHPFF